MNATTIHSTSAGTQYTGEASIGTITLTAGSGADATCNIIDNTANSGTTIIALAAAAKTSHSVPLNGVKVGTGIYLNIAGSGASCSIEIL